MANNSGVARRLALEKVIREASKVSKTVSAISNGMVMPKTLARQLNEKIDKSMKGLRTSHITPTEENMNYFDSPFLPRDGHAPAHYDQPLKQDTYPGAGIDLGISLGNFYIPAPEIGEIKMVQGHDFHGPNVTVEITARMTNVMAEKIHQAGSDKGFTLKVPIRDGRTYIAQEIYLNTFRRNRSTVFGNNTITEAILELKSNKPFILQDDKNEVGEINEKCMEGLRKVIIEDHNIPIKDCRITWTKLYERGTNSKYRLLIWISATLADDIEFPKEPLILFRYKDLLLRFEMYNKIGFQKYTHNKEIPFASHCLQGDAYLIEEKKLK